MHHARRLARRQMRRQPGDQPLHVLDRLGFGGAILLRPALDLARHIIFAAAVVGQADRRRIERVQPRDGGVHGVVDGRALGRIGRRHLRLPEHAALDMGHDEERRADDAVVGAIEHRLGDREALGGKRADDAVLAVHGVRGGQQLARRFSPQHVAPQRRFHEISRVGLAALELADHDGPGESGDMRAQIVFQPRHVEAQPLGDFARAGKGALAVDRGHATDSSARAKNSSNARAVAAGFSSGT